VEAVLECAANLACVGAEPLGLTNCLNFGNPEKPHVAWQLSESVRGLGDACRALGVPVVGGNVSLYNEGAAGPIYPTPVVGMVGELPDADAAPGIGFAGNGDAIALVGTRTADLAGSELERMRGGELPSGLPAVDPQVVRRTHEGLRQAVRAGAILSAHDIAEGGLAVALAECCLAGERGARVTIPVPGGEANGAPVGDAWSELFGEGPGGFVVSGPAEALRALGERVTVALIGEVSGDELHVELPGASLRAPLARLREAHSALASLFS
jgi:phosphoribosylformylglycinamidine synthase